MDKMDKINGHPVKYIVNDNVVIAVIADCMNDVMTYVDDEYKIWLPIHNVRQDIELPYVLKSIAKCSPGDVFNEEIGKRIAYRRLQRKYWEKFADRLTKYLWIMQKESRKILKDTGKFAARASNIDPLEGIVAHDD